MADWFRLDAEFAFHPKVVDLSDRAFRLHVETLGRVARLETDGDIKLRWSNPDPTVVDELVTAGLWDRYQSNLMVHDWGDFQPTHADMVARRDAGRNAARIRWGNAENNGEGNATGNAKGNAEPNTQEQVQGRNKKNYSDEAFDLVDLLRKEMENNGSKPQGTREKWAYHAQLLLDKDNRPFEEAKALVVWCQEDSFWRRVIMSTDGLRRNYDKVRLQREEEIGKSKPTRDPLPEFPQEEP